MVTRRRFPAEWETHNATWLTWPHNEETWPKNLAAAQREFELFVRTLAEVEDVNILATGTLGQQLQRRLEDISRIHLFDIPTNDSWIRDYGPTFVKSDDNTIIGLNWRYDGWGQKYPPFELDRKAAASILHQISIHCEDSDLILEGGSIDSNGQGICLTTDLCQTRRNPDLEQDCIREELCTQLGLQHVLFLPSIEIAGDDTDGHIDQVARFVAEDRVVVSQKQFDVVKTACVELDIELIEIADPDEVLMFQNVLPASYTNFYIANELVIVPEFGVDQDERAVSQIRELFPERNVLGLPSRELAVGLGSFHCLTQQQPA